MNKDLLEKVSDSDHGVFMWIIKIDIVKVIDVSKKREYKKRENSFFPYLNTVPEISLTKF